MTLDYKQACQDLVQIWTKADPKPNYLSDSDMIALDALVNQIQVQLDIDARPSKLEMALNGDKQAAREILVEMGVLDINGNLLPHYYPEQ